MSTTQPIRDREELQRFKNYYLLDKPNYRNYALIITGLNTALRINDILHLTWDMVFDDGNIRKHIELKEQKTGKTNRILLNAELRAVLVQYRSQFHAQYPQWGPYLFISQRRSGNPLSRYQAYRIIRHAAETGGLDKNISCHSLRKTFGYYAWKQGIPPAMLMCIFNHSSFQITRRYLCIDQDDKDAVFSNIRL